MIGGDVFKQVAFGMAPGIDFFFRNTEQPQWEPRLEFIRQTAERYLPSPPATAWPDLFGDAEPQEPAAASSVPHNENAFVTDAITSNQ